MSARYKQGSRAPQKGRTPADQLPGEDIHVVGISRRIWVSFAVLTLLLFATAIGLFMAWGERSGLREALEQTHLKLKETRISLEHAREAEKQALADKELLVKELSAQGTTLAEISRGEEQVKSQLEKVSSGQKSAEKIIANLKKKLEQAENDVTALTAQLEIARGELEAVREEMRQLKRQTEPYSQ